MKINTKKIIAVIVVLLVIIAGVMWFFVLNDSQDTDGPENTGRDLFPFGEILQGVGLRNPNNQGTVGDDTPNEQETIVEEGGEDTTPQLMLVSNRPTGGMVPIVRIQETEVEGQTVNEEGEIEQVVETIQVENHFVRYGSIENGSVHEARLTGDDPFTEELIVENYIPNSEKISFSDSGNHVSFQYWDTDEMSVESYLGTIEPIVILPEPCPFDLSGTVNIGDDNERVYDLHRFLNRDTRTYVATSGINSPGNESTLASEATITAIEKFQALYELEVDGGMGPATRGEMQRVCNEQQEELAEKAFDELETKYEISGYFLPQDIVSINMDPQENFVFYLHKTSGAIRGVLQSLNTQATETIFNSPFTQWTSMWNNDENIELTTKPSYASPGYSYELDVQGGDFHKSFKQRNGLTVIPDHSGEKLLVHHVDTGRPKLSIYERATNRFLPLTLETFTDKCVWSDNDEFIYCAVPDGLAYGEEYPDTWYQGLETYSDSLWRINASTLQEELLSNIPVEYDQSIDVSKIAVDPTNQYLYLIDKNTEYLWSYRIDEV